MKYNIGLFRKKSDLTTQFLLLSPNAFDKSKYPIYSLCAHCVLSYHLINIGTMILFLFCSLPKLLAIVGRKNKKFPFNHQGAPHMVLTLEGNLDIGAQMWRKIDDLISTRHLIISKAVGNLI